MKLSFTQQLTMVMTVLIAALLWTPALVAQEALQQIKAETDRLQQSLTQKPVSDPEWKELQPEIAAALERSRTAARSGRIFLSLEELGRGRRALRATENEKQRPEIAEKGLAGFEADWEKSRLELVSHDQNAGRRLWTNSPVAVRALAESAQGRVQVLVEASKAYAKVTSPEAGFYYLGEARADSEFARFCSELHLARQGALFSPHSIAPELQHLQDRVNAAFQPPRSIEKHSEFIRLNAVLKSAEELNQAKLYAGSLYQYLDALQQFEMMNATAPDKDDQEGLRRELAASAERIKSSKDDDSIAELFLQRAQSASEGSFGSPDWKKVAVIVKHVLPAFFAAKGTAPIKQLTAAHEVTVTLVRWPYT